MDTKEVQPTPSTPATQGNHGFNFNGDKCSKKSIIKNWTCKSTVDRGWDLEDGRSLYEDCSFPPPVTLARMLGAEFLGTFMLIFAGTATAIVNQKTHGSESLLGLAASCGLAVTMVILSTGHISGAHVNPAVTISFAALKRFSWFMLLSRIVRYQFDVMLFYRETTGASMNPARTLGPAIAANNFRAIWLYLIAPTFGALFGAGAYSAVKRKVQLQGSSEDNDQISNS